LPADAALVDFLEFWYSKPSSSHPGQLDWQRSLLALVLRPGPKVKMFHLGGIAPITEAIDAWRGPKQQPTFGLSEEAQAAGKLLREKLWQPLESAIGDAKLVLISPDGALGRLPFGALAGKQPGTYLIEDYRIALVPVPQLIPSLVNISNRKILPKELLVVGGVVYDRAAQEAVETPPIDAVAAARPWRPWQRDLEVTRSAAPNGEWPFLRGSDSEVVFIKDLYQQATKAPVDRIEELRGDKATKERFCAIAPHCSLLHIATHGFFVTPDKSSSDADDRGDGGNMFGGRLDEVRSQSPGLLSGLVLAGANDPPKIPEDASQLENVPDDGYLTADEIAFLPLSGAQLVVLSACETGLGEVSGGEGLLGIQRAFQVAGARTTIATLWKVNDEATRRIMEEFYRYYLKEGLSPLDSLREAQLWALKNPDLVPRGGSDPVSNTNTGRLPPKFWAAFTISGDWR
jgi:CHAT domain-containing protein